MARTRTKAPAADGPSVDSKPGPPPAEPIPQTLTEAKAAVVVSTAVDMLPSSEWVRRWWIIRLTLLLFSGIDITCVAQILALRQPDAPALVYIFMVSTTAIMGIVGSYVFGAVWDDNATKAAVTEITTTMGKK